MELFARSASKAYFARTQRLLGIKSAGEIGALIERYKANPNLLPRYNYRRLDIEMLIGLEKLGTRP